MNGWAAKTWSLNGIAISLVCLMASCGGNPQDAGYLGQQPPGETPEPFAPGIVNTDAIELNGVVSPDGREFFFTRVIDDVFIMHRCLLGEDGGWSEPEPVYVYPDRAPGLAVDMAYSPDGSRLYFLGRYSEDLKAEETNSDLFVIERQGNGGIWHAQRLADGRFDEPVNLGPPVNSEHSEGDTYVAPDESWLVVTSRRPGGIGGGDLYVSFRQGDGAWGEPQLLPPTINSDVLDFCPMVTPDGRYLFFSRRTGDSWDEADAGNVFWVDAAAIEKMRP